MLHRERHPLLRSASAAAFASLLALLGAACGDDGPSAEPDSGLADSDAGPDAAPDAGPVTCDERAPLPVAVETLHGFTSAEDFAFGSTGNYVGLDGNGDLLSITRDGTAHLLVPGIAEYAAGTHFLPNGDLIVAAENTLVRITPDGAVTPLLTGLEYPNGLDVARDGTIYVAETSANRLRAVNPDTGEFRVVGVAMNSANGVAIRDDEQVVYVGSFGAGVVYEVDLTNPDPLTRSRIFGRTPGGGEGTPEPVAPCAGLAAGDDCTGYAGPGTCGLFGGALDCLPTDPCINGTVGDACFSEIFGEGTCQAEGVGALVCTAIPPCDADGAACTTDWGLPGICVAGDAGIACLDAACVEHAVGDACVDSDGANGLCAEHSPGDLYCNPLPICAGSIDGDECTTSWGVPGRCDDTGQGLECVDAACYGHALGDACVDPDGHVAQCLGDTTFVYCYYLPPCYSLELGDACLADIGTTGTCVDTPLAPVCQPEPGCGGAGAGDACATTGGLAGHCDGELVCIEDDACAGSSLGDACKRDLTIDGFCVADGETLACVQAPCTVLGAECHAEADLYGTCTEVPGQGLICDTYYPASLFDSCAGGVFGDPCQVETDDGHVLNGVCADAPGTLVCAAPDDNTSSCVGQSLGDPCQVFTPFGSYGAICMEGEAGAGLVCASSGGEGGGLDGLNVDACGYVYVTEYILGYVWRIDPQGVVEKVAELDSSWIPNAHWGSGVGGWDPQVLYVADRDQGRLFGLQVNVPGAFE